MKQEKAIQFLKAVLEDLNRITSNEIPPNEVIEWCEDIECAVTDALHEVENLHEIVRNAMQSKGYTTEYEVKQFCKDNKIQY